MTKLTIVTVAVWLSGVSSAAALVTTLARPPVPAQSKVEVPRAPAPEPAPNLENFKIPKPLIVPTQIRSQVNFTRTRKHEMRCTAFKPLQIGPVDRGVRYCQ